MHTPADVSAETCRRLGCDCSLVHVTEDADGEPLNVGRKTRAIPPAMMRALRLRDHGCRFPGCSCTRWVDGHHIHHWADGGETRLSNLVLLCRFHHRLIHEGGFSLVRTDDGVLVFRRPDGSRLEAAGDSVDLAAPGDALLRSGNAMRGIDIDAATGVTRWGGERLDYDIAIDGLLRRDRRSAARPSPH